MKAVIFLVFNILLWPNAIGYQTALLNGQGIPTFKYTTLKGEVFTNASLKGKIWLIEFWASWCGPCRIQNEHLRILVNNLQTDDTTFSKNFGIIGISLDTDTLVWQKAIRNDLIEWDHQVCDTLKWKGPTASAFELRSLPFNYLVDGNGKILAQGLHGIALKEKIIALVAN